MVNVLARLNYSKRKVNDLDGPKLKTVPIDLKKLSDIVDNQIVKNTYFYKLEAKVSAGIHM